MRWCNPAIWTRKRWVFWVVFLKFQKNNSDATTPYSRTRDTGFTKKNHGSAPVDDQSREAWKIISQNRQFPSRQVFPKYCNAPSPPRTWSYIPAVCTQNRLIINYLQFLLLANLSWQALSFRLLVGTRPHQVRLIWALALAGTHKSKCYEPE